MIVGCYTMHLYCDFCKAEDKPDAAGFMNEFTGRTEADCFKSAKKAGWRLYSMLRKARCPKCVALQRADRPLAVLD